MNKFNKIYNDIKSIKIQGAHNIAIKGLESLNYRYDVKKIISARPTEPTLINAIKFSKLTDLETAKNYLIDSQKRTIEEGIKLLKDKKIVFTHCHSGTVINVLKEAKKQGYKFEVYNTETRPLYQGRKTVLDLVKEKIKVTHFVDSAADEAISQSDIVFLGADMVTSKAEAINKIGSDMISKIAKNNKVPLYILTSEWKYSSKKIKIEERPSKEVWNKKNKYLKIKNPAFEIISPKYIKRIVSGLGTLKPKKFVKKVRKTHTWIK